MAVAGLNTQANSACSTWPSSAPRSVKPGPRPRPAGCGSDRPARQAPGAGNEGEAGARAVRAGRPAAPAGPGGRPGLKILLAHLPAIHGCVVVAAERAGEVCAIAPVHHVKSVTVGVTGKVLKRRLRR
jgi:hypothetical protein